eukprot:scaffold420449_cov45-Prasinocladus_malaysianus.AAC.1
MHCVGGLQVAMFMPVAATAGNGTGSGGQLAAPAMFMPAPAPRVLSYDTKDQEHETKVEDSDQDRPHLFVPSVSGADTAHQGHTEGEDEAKIGAAAASGNGEPRMFRPQSEASNEGAGEPREEAHKEAINTWGSTLTIQPVFNLHYLSALTTQPPANLAAPVLIQPIICKYSAPKLAIFQNRKTVEDVLVRN